jgi:DNA-binding NarL/FixJ family response regulator
LTDRTAEPKAPSKPGYPVDQLYLRILRDYAGGASLGSIASNNHLSERSVRRRLRSACEAFNVSTAIEAVVIAVRQGLL